MSRAKQTGAWGEQFAADRLVQDGYRILYRNYRSGHSEIDLIAVKNTVIAFVEVKTRVETAYTTPAGSVSKAQCKRIVLAAVEYLREHGLYGTGQYQPRFDIFEVVVSAEDQKLLRYGHIPSAFTTEGLDVFI